MTNKSPKTSLAKLNELKSKMAAMPAKVKEEFNNRETVQNLEIEIRSLLSDGGYSLIDIAKMFAETGISITSSSIAAYLREFSEGSNARKKKAKAEGRKSPSPTSNGNKAVGPQPAVTHPSTASSTASVDPHALTSGLAPSLIQPASPTVSRVTPNPPLIQKDAGDPSLGKTLDKNLASHGIPSQDIAETKALAAPVEGPAEEVSVMWDLDAE